MTTEWAGSYYERESAPRRDVRVIAEPAGVSIKSAGGTTTWPFAELVQRSGSYPGEPVRLDRGAEILVIADRAFLDDLHRHAPQFGQAVRSPNASRALTVLMGSFVLIGGLIVTLVWLARPAIEDTVGALIPASVEESMGRATAAQVSMTAATCSSTPLLKTVNAIALRLSTATEGHEYSFRVSVVADPTVNAFAAPGGYIVLYRGLVQRTSTPDELAGVLAHEMQHIAQRHSLKGLVRTIGLITLISLVTGDAAAIAGAAGELSSLSFQREDEEEADREGMRTLQRARLDPAGMVSMYEKLACESGELPGALRYLSTHPQTADRIEKLKRLAAEAQYQPVEAEGRARWNQLKELCE